MDRGNVLGGHGNGNCNWNHLWDWNWSWNQKWDWDCNWVWPTVFAPSSGVVVNGRTETEGREGEISAAAAECARAI